MYRFNPMLEMTMKIPPVDIRMEIMRRVAIANEVVGIIDLLMA
jgi:hypothetical protein